MRIGIDLDNTIVCYDDLFQRLAAERALAPPSPAMSKTSVRDHLRRSGRENEWTLLQGEAYGPRMAEARAFLGVLDFIIECRRASIAVCIISHKTRHPLAGPPYDLHRAGRDWLEHAGFFTADTGLTSADVFFELTKEHKLKRIAQQRCTCFIDDLPELLSDPAFPAQVQRVLFDPASQESCLRRSSVMTLGAWRFASQLLFHEVTT